MCTCPVLLCTCIYFILGEITSSLSRQTVLCNWEWDQLLACNVTPPFIPKLVRYIYYSSIKCRLWPVHCLHYDAD